MRILRRLFLFKKYTFIHYSLLILIGTLIFLGILIFLYQYVKGTNEAESSGEEVLQSSSVRSGTGQNLNLRPITRYKIEYIDYDGKPKSIRPKDCIGFDNVSPGIVSFMKRTCIRNYLNPSVFPYANPYIGSWVQFNESPQQFDGFYMRANAPAVEFFSLRPGIGTSLQGARDNRYPEFLRFPLNSIYQNTAQKEMFIFQEWEAGQTPRTDGVLNNIPEPIPILTEYRGIPLMFYYGGVYEINKNDQTAYLLTRLFDTDSYYSKLCTSKNIPTSVYQVEDGNYSRYFFRNEVKTSIIEQYCSTRCTNSYSSNNANVDCTNGISVNRLDCKEHGIGLNFMEAFEQSGTSGTNFFSDKHTCRLFQGIQRQSRYGFRPILDQLLFQNIPSCPFTQNGACLELGGNRVKVSIKLSTDGTGANEGAAPSNSRYRCIGLYEGDKCLELIEYGAKDTRFWARSIIANPPNNRPNRTSETRYSGETYNPQTGVRTVSCASNPNCFNSHDLLFENASGNPVISTMFSPYTNASGGYDMPYWIASNDYYGFNPRAIDYSETFNNRKIVRSYSSAFDKHKGPNEIGYRNDNMNDSSIDYTFSDEFYTYAIDLNPASSSFKIFRFFVANGDRFEIDEGPTVSLSGFPSSLIKKENISISFSTQSRTLPRFDSNGNLIDENRVENIDILFSDKEKKSSTSSKLFRISSAGWATYFPEPGEKLIVTDITNSIPDQLKSKVILNLKRYPSDTSTISSDNDYYVWVTPDLVYTSDVYKSDCVLGTPSISITNTSPRSNVTNSWPLPLSQFLGSSPDLINIRVSSTNNLSLNCLGNRITASNIVIANPTSPAATISINANSVLNGTNLDNIYFRTQNFLLPGFSYPIRQINFSIAGKNYRFSNPPANTIFGSRGWMISTENFLNLNFTKLGQNFPINNTTNFLQLRIEKLGSSGNILQTAIFYKNSPDPVQISSSNSSAFYWDNSPLRYRVCLESQSETFSNNINITTPNYRVTRLNERCLLFEYLRPGIQQSISVALNATALQSEGMKWNGNVFLRNPTGHDMVYKSIPIVGSNKMFEGSLLYKSGTPFNPWDKKLANSSISTTFFRKNQTGLNNFQTLNNLSTLNNSSTSNFVLLTSNVSYVESGLTLPASSYINTFTTIPASKKYQIIALSKGRGINLNLDNNFVNGAGKVILNRYVFVNLDPNIPGRLRLTVDCQDPNYSLICNSNSSYNIKGSIIGAGILNFQNMLNQVSDRVIIHENPDIAVHLTKDLRSKKYNLVTSSKVIVRYLD